MNNPTIDQIPSHGSQDVQLRHLIRERCGLYFRDHELKTLDETVQNRMQEVGITDLRAYLQCITDSQDEFCELLNRLTIRHTYFFRNEPQFNALRFTVLPELIATKRCVAGIQGRPSLKVWSAGCSTGEEPYSIAMVIRDLLPDVEQWDIKVLATDVSTHAVTSARKGSFGEGAMKLVSPQNREQYFSVQQSKHGSLNYLVRKSIRDMVEFRYLNLLEDAFPTDVDVIFCRNVMIYFDEATFNSLVQQFYRSLTAQGSMFIGYSETLQGIDSGFTLVMDHEGVYYRKGRHGEHVDPTPSHTAMSIRKPKKVIAVSNPPVKADLLEDIQEAVTHKEYERAWCLIRQIEPTDDLAIEAYYWAALIYTNQGNYPGATQWLDKIFALNSLFAPAYFLKGTIQIECEDYAAAQEALKKALYLDPRFPMAHMAMAAAYLNQGGGEEAVREYTKAIKIMAKEDPEAEVPHAGGFNHSTLISICYNNIERIQNEL